MALRVTGYGHVCICCAEVSQWPSPVDYTTGNYTTWAACYACGRVTITKGNRGRLPTAELRKYRAIYWQPWNEEDIDPGYDVEGQKPSENFDPLMLLEDWTNEESCWFPRDSVR